MQSSYAVWRHALTDQQLARALLVIEGTREPTDALPPVCHHVGLTCTMARTLHLYNRRPPTALCDAHPPSCEVSHTATTLAPRSSSAAWSHPLGGVYQHEPSRCLRRRRRQLKRMYNGRAAARSLNRLRVRMQAALDSGALADDSSNIDLDSVTLTSLRATIRVASSITVDHTTQLCRRASSAAAFTAAAIAAAASLRSLRRSYHVAALRSILTASRS